MPLPQSYLDALPAITSVRNANPTTRRSLVVLYLGGGADCHNTLTPRTGANRSAYTAARPTASIADNPATALDADWQLHPALTALKARWDAGKLAVIPNCGPLVVPTSKAQAQAASVPLPVQLYSHSDQSAQWQFGRAGVNASIDGWLGRAFDLLHSVYNTGANANRSFNFSSQIAQNANETKQFALRELTGPATRTLDGTTNGVSASFDAMNAAIAAAYPAQPIITSHSALLTDSNAAAVSLSTAYNATTNPATVTPNTSIANQLRTIGRMIAAQQSIGHERSIHFAVQGGYDQHADLVNVLSSNYTTLNAALSSWEGVQTDLGIRDRVVTLIYSEFGRSLVQNNTGTDHAWGGHAFVFGDSVTGGYYGTLPDLSLTGQNMIDSRGYLVPTTSFETIYASLLRWMGVPDVTDNGVNPMKLVLPNIDNFPARSFAGMLPPMTGA